MTHHVVDIVRLDGQSHELRFEELANGVNPEIVASTI